MLARNPYAILSSTNAVLACHCCKQKLCTTSSHHVESAAFVQLLLDLDHPEAQQALLTMQGAARTQKSSGHALSASVKPAATAEQHGMPQPDAAEAAKPQQGTPPVQAARHSRHAGVQPTAAETSTECFARLEALAGQPEGLSGMCCPLSMTLHHRHVIC